MHEADWKTFQAELDTCSFVVLGRRSHEATPNAAGRQRVVLTQSVVDLEKRSDGWWWNPQTVTFAQMAVRLAPQGGKVGVPGGQGVFDHFLAQGTDEFHLTRALNVHLPGGRKVFSGSATANERLATAGLVPDPAKMLDGDGAIELTIRRKPLKEGLR